MLAHVFEPFIQADRTLDRSRGGLGLGLTLVKGLVEAHGGTVAVASDGAGRGATFTIRFPVTPAPPAVATDVAVDAPPGPRRVLLVEDNADAAESLRDAIALLGHEVHVGRSGPEGIAIAREIRPDVVLCDIGLPGADGYEVARTLRALVPHALLVAMTGYGMPDDKQRAKDAGFAHHVTKPPRLAELVRLLAAAEPRAYRAPPRVIGTSASIRAVPFSPMARRATTWPLPTPRSALASGT
jgi:two-component system CheB/CheR fusion protein